MVSAAPGVKAINNGWVYTVIAGVLNILVIYDGFAGPAFARVGQPKGQGTAESVATPDQPRPQQEAVAL